ncbi:uncharacterized protein N7511_002481 [Penicillium nucicola]|uniref:uncharacterized protein n=1 Tax=Penicillium nucicola TaxID=1850975 RepID=UPI002545876C|nr:uncharacterized protein N7511_002481 [Penicillium nucicola]KAJ5770430.1 hypothetical protein N7511_002481 [Penicillium nucicola]
MPVKHLKGFGNGFCARVTPFHLHGCSNFLSTTSKLPKARDITNSKLEQEQNKTSLSTPSNEDSKRHPVPRKTKLISEADAELRERLEQMSGEGGASGIEYEDGKPSAMKRGVRNNMFRLI